MSSAARLALPLPVARRLGNPFPTDVRATREQKGGGPDATLDSWGFDHDADDVVGRAGRSRAVDAVDRRRSHRATDREPGTEPRAESGLRDGRSRQLARDRRLVARPSAAAWPRLQVRA